MLNKTLITTALSLAAFFAVAQPERAEARFKLEPVKAEATKPVVTDLTKAEEVTPSPLPSPGPCASCCPKPCIIYRCVGPKLCCGCEPGVPTTLMVKRPCTDCEVEVNVCAPACCKGEPTICSHPGAFGRGVVIYEWCCGYRVKVVFRACDVVVIAWGR